MEFITDGLDFSDAGEKVSQLEESFRDSPPGPLSLNSENDLMAFIDFTSLEATDSVSSIGAFCKKAISFYDPSRKVPYPAAVCVFPNFVRLAKKNLFGSPIRVASVAGAFPSGQSSLAVKLQEIRYVVENGADEVDVVLSRGKFLDGDFDEVFEEISAMREACRGLTLKVILETAELGSPVNIARASELALRGGADFIKTSTGKIDGGATPLAAYVMSYTLKQWKEKSGMGRGLKVSGGVREPWQAMRYYRLFASVMQTTSITAADFRIGASRLAEKLTLG